MNIRMLTVLLASAALATVACQPQAPETGDAAAAVDTTAILASIDSLRSAYEQAVADGNWARLESLVTDEAVMVSPGSSAWDSLYLVLLHRTEDGWKVHREVASSRPLPERQE